MDYSTFLTAAEQWYHNRLEAEKTNVYDGHLFNVFSLWNRFSHISEPIHSRLIHFLLSDDRMHGQGSLFRYCFLNTLGISNPNNGEWIVTAEEGRVDVMLARKHPHSVVIIENKSNGAQDQPNQLYRYWYQNIHSGQADTKATYYFGKNYRIIYLVPRSCKKKPANQSCTKPDKNSFEPFTRLSELQYKRLPLEIPIEPIIWSLDDEFSRWLEDCISKIDPRNIPLINYLNQYIKYCKIL